MVRITTYSAIVLAISLVAPSSATAQDSISITCSAIDQETTKPVRGAVISMTQTVPPRLVIDGGRTPNGTLTLKAYPGGSAILMARADGYAPSRIEVKVGEEDEYCAIPLGRGVSISGRALREDGTPAARAYVLVEYRNRDDLMSHLVHRSTIAAEDGSFDIDGLLSGVIFIRAILNDETSNSRRSIDLRRVGSQLTDLTLTVR